MNILGTHSFPTFIHHKECQHGPLPAIDRKPYMEPGPKLIKVVWIQFMKYKITRSTLPPIAITNNGFHLSNMTLKINEYLKGLWRWKKSLRQCWELISTTLTILNTIQVNCMTIKLFVNNSSTTFIHFCMNSEFVQTGPNESLNSVTTLKYLEKTVSYRL